MSFETPEDCATLVVPQVIQSFVRSDAGQQAIAMFECIVGSLSTAAAWRNKTPNFTQDIDITTLMNENNYCRPPPFGGVT